jgi:hypothetical protein
MISVLFAAAIAMAPPSAAVEDLPADTVRRAIIVSLEQQKLWLMINDSLVMEKPVGVGSGRTLSSDGRSWTFDTPKGLFHVTSRQRNPDWVPPIWHFHDKAATDGLRVHVLKMHEAVELADGTLIEVRDGEVGRVNHFGNFWPFTQGTHIIFDGVIYVPLIGTLQRRVPGTLGTRRLNLVDGYAIHGTDSPDSVPGRTSAGCIRMKNEDIEALYDLVRVGTVVLIY